MGRKKHKGHFWHRWQEAKKSFEEGHEGNFGHRRLWHSHLEDHFGVAPEEHWLFAGRRFKAWTSGSWGTPGMFNPFVAELMSKGGGLLSIFVLNLLAEKPRYGNDIMREIEERMQGKWGPNPGAVYPLLSAMEKEGLVISEWEDPDKRTRRIYQLTPEGQDELLRLKEVMRPKLEEAINVLRNVCDNLGPNEESNK